VLGGLLGQVADRIPRVGAVMGAEQGRDGGSLS
jgi:hypothetical protein